MSRFQEFYRNEVVGQLTKQFGYKSVMEVPRITKITLNMGVGEEEYVGVGSGWWWVAG